MNSNIPHGKSEKDAVKALIEASALEASPQVLNSVPDLESWVRVKQCRTTQEPLGRVKRSSSSMGKPPIIPLKTLQRATFKRRKKQTFCKSARENNEINLVAVPMVSQLFPYPCRTSSKILAIARQNSKKRSNSMSENKESKENKENQKDIEIPIMKKMVNKLVKNSLLKRKQKKESQKLYKVNSVYNAGLPRVLTNKNSNT